MARLAGKHRGDMRAMEEQMERHNPVRGRGATPSMGLSQFRGGGTGADCKILSSLFNLNSSYVAFAFNVVRNCSRQDYF
jgi:hypothetical protein